MQPTSNGHPVTTFGTPTRLILLGYYDGPTDGVIQFGAGGPVFRLVMPDEEAQLSRQSFPREYAFHPLPADAIDRLEAILAEHLTPKRPAWYVNWQFESPEIEAEIDSRVSAILNEAGPAAWSVTVPVCWSFEDFQPSRVVALQSA
jgi:hypothetical protein